MGDPGRGVELTFAAAKLSDPLDAAVSLGSKASTELAAKAIGRGLRLETGRKHFHRVAGRLAPAGTGISHAGSRARNGTGRRRASGPSLLVHSTRGRVPASRRQANRDPRFPPFRRPSGGSASREHYPATFVQSSACCGSTLHVAPIPPEIRDCSIVTGSTSHRGGRTRTCNPRFWRRVLCGFTEPFPRCARQCMRQ